MIENALTERDTDNIYSVTELANLLGITPRAIRFYESKGLVSPRRAGTTRVYNYRDRGRLQIILRGKRLGFSLAEIREYLHLRCRSQPKRTTHDAARKSQPKTKSASASEI